MRAVPVLLSLALSSPLSAQSAREITLGAPTGAHPGEFGMINGVRELADGSVLVADPMDRVLKRLDRTLAQATTLGRSGAGPGEHKQPDSVWPLPGDSTLLVDLGNARLTALDNRGRFGNTTPIVSGGDAGPGSMTFMIPGGIDHAGNIYFRAMSRGDSNALMKHDRRTGRTEQVASLKAPEMKTTESGGPNNRNVSSRPVPLSPQDGWAVSPSGLVYVVRASDYHVDVRGPDGSWRSGAPVNHRPVPIGRAEREEWQAEVQRRGGVGVGVEMNNGQRSVTLQRGRPPQSTLDDLPWPEAKPAFGAAHTWVDGRERLWVRRNQPAGQPWRYDLFDPRGQHIGTVQLPADRQVAGMGLLSVYLVRFDDSDLQYLERYALP